MEKLLLVLGCVLVHLGFAVMLCSATTYNVGDNSGWDISTNLDTWAQDKKLKVGDALVFQYSSSDSVDEVTKENFKTCNINKVLATYGNGNTTVPLTKPGDRYFVSGNKLYCLGGMKLHVHVEGDNANAPALAPAPGKAVTSLNNGASVVPRQPVSSKKNIPLPNGAVKCALNVALVVPFLFWMFQI